MPTYTQIGTAQVVGVLGAASMDFTSIPSTYTDLCVLVSARQSGAASTASLNMSLNGSTSNFTYRYLQGAGSGTPTSGSGSTGYIGQTPAATATANTFGNAVIYIPNYLASTNKSISSPMVTTSCGLNFAMKLATFFTATRS